MKRRKPIWKPRFSSEIMKAGVTTCSGVSMAVFGRGALERRMKRPRSSRSTWLSMKRFTGMLAAPKACGSSIWWASSGLMPAL